MAATTIGTSGLSFGITAESGGLVQSFTETRNVQRAEVRNQSGEVVGAAMYNPTDTFTFTTTITGTYATTAGAVITTLANAASTGGKMIIDSVTTNKSSDGFVTVNVSVTRFPNMTELPARDRNPRIYD
jgi:hypothetical protein